jgi:HSP20 family protein
MRQSAAGALTRFRPGEQASVPASRGGRRLHLPSHGWSMLGGDMFEDDRSLVVQLEVPAMDKDEFDIEVLDDALGVAAKVVRKPICWAST